MAAGLNHLAERVTEALTRARPEFAATKYVLDQGDVELHITAPATSKAGALVVSTARGEDIWIRFAPPQMFYGVDDEEELVRVVSALLQDRAFFVRIVDDKGEWAGTTLVSQNHDIDLEAGQRASVLSWSGRFDEAYAAETPAPSWIEFHDSHLVGVAFGDAGVELSLDAYVHAWDVIEDQRRGTGWMQPVKIKAIDARASAVPDVLPVDISDGQMIVGTVPYRNLVPLPFSASESMHLRLEFVTGDFLDLTGSAVNVVASGSARYVEDLPADFWPGDPQ